MEVKEKILPIPFPKLTNGSYITVDSGARRLKIGRDMLAKANSEKLLESYHGKL
jgi:hypothetical protein